MYEENKEIYLSAGGVGCFECGGYLGAVADAAVCVECGERFFSAVVDAVV